MTEPDPLAGALRAFAGDPRSDDALATVRRRHRRRIRGRWAASGLAAIVLAGSIVGALALDRDRSGGDPPPPSTLEVIAPDDGRQSANLPVQVTPRVGLADGDEVVVTGRRFPAGVAVGVTMCLPEALTGDGVDACDIGLARTDVGTDGEGRFEVVFTVRRLLTVSPDVEPLDCAVVEGGCIVAAGVLDDYDQSGGMAVSFDPSAPAPTLPQVTVMPDQQLEEGDRIRVDIEGFGPGEYLGGVNQCALTPDRSRLDGCEGLPDGTRARAGREGRLSFGATVYRRLEPWGPGDRTVDCAEDPCALVVSGLISRVVVPLGFDPDSPPPDPVGVDVDLPEVVDEGDRVRVTATGLRPGDDLIVNLCPSEAVQEAVPSCEGEGLGYEPADRTGRATIVVTIPSTHVGWYPSDVALQPADGSPIRVDCRERPGRCELVVHTFYRVRDRVPLTFE